MRIVSGELCAVDSNTESFIGSKVHVRTDGCWIYNGKPDEYGVARLSRGGRSFDVRVHRFVYETLVGPIPDGHVLHHECETPGCCNPAHLVPLTIGDHNRRHAEMRH